MRCLNVRLSWILSCLAFVSPKLGLAQAPSATPAAAPTPPADVLTVEADRPDALYHVGDEVSFAVALTHGGSPATDDTEQIAWTISKDGVAPIETGTTALDQGRATLHGKLAEPGFLHCEIELKRGKDVIHGVGAAGIDPEKIKPSLPAPDDFDAFWKAKVAELEAMPINPRLTPMTPPPIRKGVEVFDVQADCLGGKPMSGYFARPIGAKAHSLPAMINFHGAGVDSADLDHTCGWAGAGFLYIDLNAHGIPNGKPPEFYRDLANGESKNYRFDGRESRDTYYFLGMYLRARRALDFLTSQPEWDGRTLISSGASQGGAQAIAAAALDERVTYLAALEPAMCDHTGMVAGRIAGWPKLVTKGADGKPDLTILEVSRYFDSVNFASRYKGEAWFSVGFLDVICPPTGICAAYNSVTGKKDLLEEIQGGHNHPPPPGAPSIWAELRKRVLAKAAEMEGTKPK